VLDMVTANKTLIWRQDRNGLVSLPSSKF